MEDDGRVISPVAGLDELMTEEKIRPQYLRDYIGNLLFVSKWKYLFLQPKRVAKHWITF